MAPHALRLLRAVLCAVRESSTGYPDMLFRIARAVSEGLPSERVTLHVLSRRRNAFVPAADHGTQPSVVERFVGRPFAVAEFPGDADLRAGRSVVATRGSSAPAMEEILAAAQMHGLLVVPLLYRGELEGTIACGRSAAPAFGAEEVVAIEQIAPDLALLIHTSRLEAEHTRLAERRRRITAWSAEVLAADDLDAMANRLCEATRALFRTTRSALFLLEGDALVPHGAAGPYADHLRGGSLHVPPGVEPAFDEAVRRGEVLAVNDFRNSPYAATPLESALRPQAALVIPLRDVGGILGILTASDLDEPWRFGPDDAEDGRVLGALAAVSIRKGLLVDALKRADRSKSEFLASVSHDLRTPLNVLLGYTQLLGEEAFGPVTREQADTLRRMERSAEGQLLLINDLLDLARIEQGKLVCRPAPIVVAELVPGLVELMEALLRGRPIAFEVDVDPTIVVHSDRDRLHQVLVNLLGNAAKFTRKGVVRLAARRSKTVVEITISDTGPGIEPAFAERVVEPFVRGDGAVAGSGLGLAIVARLLRVLDGGLTIDSEPGRGTTVRVTLPDGSGAAHPAAAAAGEGD